MAAQYELLKELLNSGTKLDFGQEMFFKFYQAFILNDRWVQYIQGVGTTPIASAMAVTSSVQAAGTRCWASSMPSVRCTPPSSAAPP